MEIAKFTLKEKKLLKEGEGQYGTWQLVKLLAEDNEEYLTFNSKNYTEGGNYEVPYELSTKGNYTSKMLKDGKPRSGGSSELKAQVDLLTKRVEKLESFMLSQ